MTQFSSGKHEKISVDPFPYRNRATADPFASRWKRLDREITADRYILDPRPEFDRPLTNPANPILAHYRGRAARWPIDGYIRSLDPDNVWQWDEIGTSDQIAHARAVLTRLANLTTTTKENAS